MAFLVERDCDPFGLANTEKPQGGHSYANPLALVKPLRVQER